MNDTRAKRANIYITGFSGTGKTRVGREVARRLGWRFVDTDEEIVKAEGKPVGAIFSEEGESRFRELERERLAAVSSHERQVVSTGGGMVVDEDNRRTMHGSGVVVCLEASPETIRRRLDSERDGAQGPVVRPMLIDSDSTTRIEALKSQRQFAYSQADWSVQTDRLTEGQAAEEVVRAFKLLSRRSNSAVTEPDGELAAIVDTSSGGYPAWVGWGILDGLGERVRRVVSPGAAYLVTDEGAHRHARRAQVSLEAAGVPAHLFILPQGEQSKSLETAQHLYAWLARRKAERGHLVVAVGGGVVGDLAGYVAATFLRGMLFAQVPTTLLAMMDASIGGKTAVDLPQGKNLVGAFYQPSLVLTDVQTLQTLPSRELASGWAEAIKHGLILDEALFNTFEEKREPILALERSVSTEVIRRSVAIKADVVSRDEKETLGLRVVLNYGHTIGHAIEAATAYGRFLHGEAVSIGMTCAANISEGMGLLSTAQVARQRMVLESFGLPVRCGDIDLSAVSRAMSLDKKTSEGAIRWVLLDRIGHAITRNDVPAQLVEEVLSRLSR